MVQGRRGADEPRQQDDIERCERTGERRRSLPLRGEQRSLHDAERGHDRHGRADSGGESHLHEDGGRSLLLRRGGGDQRDGERERRGCHMG